MKKKSEQLPADEFWLVVAADVKVADVTDQCGVFDKEEDALLAAAECAPDSAQAVYHCQRKLLVTV